MPVVLPYILMGIYLQSSVCSMHIECSLVSWSYVYAFERILAWGLLLALFKLRMGLVLCGCGAYVGHMRVALALLARRTGGNKKSTEHSAECSTECSARCRMHIGI